jgi:hypothetical protein
MQEQPRTRQGAGPLERFSIRCVSLRRICLLRQIDEAEKERTMMKTFSACVAATVLAIAASAAPATAQTRAKVGTLNCDISGGIGMIIASKKEVTCTFTPSAGGRPEVYVGSISKFGLDIGATSGGRMVWAVHSSTQGRQRGALAGTYGGASAEATVGAGLGANVLVGGSNRSVALQPVSVQGQAGLNLAVGVSQLTLRQARG